MDHVNKVKELFEQIDRAVAAFREETALSCQNGCGRCCLSPTVEVTALEMQPLVEHLTATGEIDAAYSRAEAMAFNGPCIFYQPHPFNPAQGRCTVYPVRPTLCRLYGFSAWINKRGEKRLMPCGIMKEESSEKIAFIQSLIDGGLNVPVMKDAAEKLYNLHPVLGSERLPINMAFKVAADRTYLRFKLMKGGDPHDSSSSQTKEDSSAKAGSQTS